MNVEPEQTSWTTFSPNQNVFLKKHKNAAALFGPRRDVLFVCDSEIK